MAGPRDARLAGRPGRRLDPGGVEQVEQRVALAAGEREVGVGGQPPRRCPAVRAAPRRGPTASTPSTRESRSAPTRAAKASRPATACSTASPNDASRAASSVPGPHAALLPAAVQHGRQVEPAPREERTGAAGPAHLVPADGHRVEPRRAEVDRHLADGLHRVGVHRHAVPAARARPRRRAAAGCRPRCSPTSRRSARPGRRCAPAPRAARRRRARPSASTGRSTSSAPACSAIQNAGSSTAWCSTADTSRRRRRRSCVASGPEQTLDREVVGLGAARRPDDLARPRAEGRGEPLAGLLDHPTGRTAGRVQGRGVAGAHELLGEHPRGLREHGRGRRMVEIHAHRLQSTNDLHSCPTARPVGSPAERPRR